VGVRIIPKTSAQKLQQFPIVPRRTVLQPTVWYICPVGKKALVAGWAQCTGLGAAARGDLDVGGITKFQWDVPAGVQNDKCKWSPIGLSAAFQDRCPIRVEIAAGETFETNQNVGTNAEFNLDLEVFESDI